MMAAIATDLTSFPFLAIAKKYDVPYRDVMAMADQAEYRWNCNLTIMPSGFVEIAVAQALARERMRRRNMEVI